jgi:predicted ArsR family transcriptional regulator
MEFPSRGKYMDRSFKLINFLIIPRTVSEIAEHLEISLTQARGWIESASLHCPVVEDKRCYASGRPAATYQLMR